MIPFVLVSLLASGPGPDGIAGIYSADIRRAPKASQGILGAIFQGDFHFLPDGTFEYPEALTAGFWRREGRRVVVVNGDFFGTPFAVPDELLQRRWPKNNIEGWVFDVEPDGTLTLSAVGRTAGPVHFRRAARRPTLELVALSFTEKPGSMGAFATLSAQAPQRGNELVEILLDPKVSLTNRMWSTAFFRKGLPRPVVRRVADALIGPSLANEKRLLAHVGRTISAMASPEIMPQLIQAHRMGRMKPAQLAVAMGRARYGAGKPFLLQTLTSDDPYARREAARALARMEATDALPDLERRHEDPDPTARLAVREAILSLTTDPADRVAAVHSMARMLDKTEYENYIVIRILGESRERAALPYLVARLERGDDLDRRTAAEGLGELGCREAVPALLCIKTETPLGPVGFEKAIDYWKASAPLKKAVVEALYAIEHGKPSRVE